MTNARVVRGRDPLAPGRTVSIPIRVLQSGELAYFYGGPTPKLRPGTVADLIVEAFALVDQHVVTILRAERVVPFLPRTHGLLLVVRPSEDLPAAYRKHLHVGPVRSGGRRECGVPVYALDDQRLRLRGSKTATLEPARWAIPALDRKAHSLNEAYRLVSETFEPHRRSHSGNVFQLAFRKRGNAWRVLGDLREAAVAKHEVFLRLS